MEGGVEDDGKSVQKRKQNTKINKKDKS